MNRTRNLAVALAVGVLAAFSLAATWQDDLTAHQPVNDEIGNCRYEVPIDLGVDRSTPARVSVGTWGAHEETWLTRNTRFCPTYIVVFSERRKYCTYRWVENEDGAGSSRKTIKCEWYRDYYFRLASWCR